MSKDAKILEVFVGSPSDVSKERKLVKEVCEAIEDTIGKQQNFKIETFLWEDDTYSEMGKQSQKSIDQQAPDFDLFIGLMWKRYGTIYKNDKSGTVHEMFEALKRRNNKSEFPHVMLFFKTDKIDIPSNIPVAEQLKKVVEFKEEIRKLDLGLSHNFKGKYFKDFFRRQMDLFIPRWLNKIESQDKTKVQRLTEMGYGDLKKIEIKPDLKLIENIHFDYLAYAKSSDKIKKLLENNGWKGNRDRPCPDPTYSVGENYGSSVLTIKSDYEYHLDYNLDKIDGVELCNQVKYFVEDYTKKSSVYVGIKLKNYSEARWFRIDPTNTYKEPQRLEPNHKGEWIIFIKKEAENYGDMYTLDLKESFEKTFRQDNFEFEKVMCLRLRGDMKILKIELYS